jgi:hypothetical protein
MLVGRAPILRSPDEFFTLENSLVKLTALPIPGRRADPIAGVVFALLLRPGLIA